MSLPLSHAGGSVDGISATLDLKFASSKSLTSSSGITPSFTRASSGTYFGSDGLLKYANINRLLQSQDFTTTWSSFGATASSNTTTAPDGTLTADTITANAGTALKSIYQTGLTLTSVNVATSVYAKKGTHDKIQILYGGTGNTEYANFDLTNGVVGSGTGTLSMVNVGNGWYRCVHTITSSTISDVYFSLIDTTAAGRAATATTTGSVFLWGAQLETGSTPGTYVPTTSAANSAPRFDHVYNGTSWISKGLLVEEQRTNYAKYANDLSTNWTNESGATREYNSIVSPDGGTNATKVNVAVSAFSGIYQTPLLNAGSGIYTYSIFAKKGTKDWLWILNTAGAGGTSTNFNISNGTIGTVNSGYSATITNCGNGWYRCTLTTTTSALSYFQLGFSDANNSVTPASTGYSYVYGAQIELGSFATSFIPNNTAGSVTRSADVCQIAGTDFSGFWNASEGSFAVEYDLIGQTKNADRSVVLFGTSNGSGSYACYYEDYFGNEYWKNYTTDYSLVLGTTSVGQVNRFAGCVKTNDVAATRNGSAVLTDTSTTIKTGQVALGIGCVADTAPSTFWNGHIARLRYFNKRLTNQQLEDLCKPEQQLKLDLNFSSSLSLTPTVGPTPSFSRASTGTYFNSAGVLTSAAINGPRFDHVYNGSSWVSKGLLIEEQRTNQFTYSDQFNDASWTKAQLAVSTNLISAPDSTVTADKIIDTAVNNVHAIYKALTVTIGQAYSLSVYAKSGERSILTVNLPDTGVSDRITYFNLSNGTIGTNSSESSASITPVGNGWYRCSISRTAGVTNPYAEFGMAIVDGSRTYTGNGTSGLYLWGAQLEYNSFPTSYIPTTTAAVTRSADVCQITGTNFSGMWNSSEGSLIAEWDTYYASNQNMIVTTSAAVSAADNLLQIRNDAAYGFVAGATQFAFPWTVSSNVLNKASLAIKANDFAASINGSSVQTDISGSLPNSVQMDLGQSAAYTVSPYKLNGHISRLRYYAIRLPNRLLIAKST